MMIRRRNREGKSPGAIGMLILVLVAVGLSCRAKEESIPAGQKAQLTILHSSSLAVPLQGVTAEFEKSNPSIAVKAEAVSDLEAARMISEQGKQADIFAASDYTVIENLVMPKAASWYLKFARNYVTIAFTPKAKFADKVNSFNWYEFLVQPDVRMGCADPNLDPLGFRSLMAMQLAERFYDKKGLCEELKKNCPSKNIRPNSSELLSMLESGELDYAWLYRSVAKQRGLKFINLPPEVDLSSGSFADMYKQAKVEISGATPGSKRTVVGEPVVYGITIPSTASSSTAQEAAVKYLVLLLGPTGRGIFEKHSQMLLIKSSDMPQVSCEASDKTKVPAVLAKFCK
jgi:molybdate/tungstate transport system substrate-binding protein